MGFRMIDRIVSHEPGSRIEALKQLSICEEYLADHFPEFPVMPGVLMLEALLQAAGWLLRLSGDDEGTIFLLVTAKTIRYGNFVKPGDELKISVQLLERDGDTVSFKGKGTVGGKNAVQGRFSLKRLRLGEIHPGLEENENFCKEYFTRQARVLRDYTRELTAHGAPEQGND